LLSLYDIAIRGCLIVWCSSRLSTGAIKSRAAAACHQQLATVSQSAVTGHLAASISSLPLAAGNIRPVRISWPSAYCHQKKATIGQSVAAGQQQLAPAAGHRRPVSSSWPSAAVDSQQQAISNFYQQQATICLSAAAGHQLTKSAASHQQFSSAAYHQH